MRRIVSLAVVVLALATSASAASLSTANILAINKNWARTIDTLSNALTFGQADISANHTRAAAIGDVHGAGASIANAMLRDSVTVSLTTMARPFVEYSMRALANVFRDPDLQPVGGTGTKYTSMNAFCSGEFTAGQRLAPEVAQVWRSIFGNGSLAATICAPPVATSYGTVEVSGATTCDLDSVVTPIDVTLYDGGLLEAYVTTEMVSSNNDSLTRLTITGKDINGSAWQGTCYIADTSAVTATTNVTATLSNTFPVRLTAVTVTNGGSGKVTIRVRRDYAYTQ